MQPVIGRIIGGGEYDYGQSSARMMQNAQQAMGSQRPVREEDPGPSLGGALGAGMGSALSMAGTGAAIGTIAAEGSAMATMAAGMAGPVGLAIGAGIGILSHLFS